MTSTAELAKLPAFVRRDVRIAFSYRMGFFGALFGLAAQALVFSFIGKLVNPAQLPEFGGSRVSYMEFVTIGIAMNLVVVLLLGQVATAIRGEQLMGTLESLLVTPTRVATIQAGSAALAVITIPLRLAVFIGVLGVLFGLHFAAGGVLPAIVIVVSFLPFLWGVGLLAAGAILTFRRGTGALPALTTALSLASGAFFPLSVLPHWLHTMARANPLSIAITGLRDCLIGGTGWASVGSDVLELAPLSIIAMALGVWAFRLALQRERRNGSLGLY